MDLFRQEVLFKASCVRPVSQSFLLPIEAGMRRLVMIALPFPR